MPSAAADPQLASPRRAGAIPASWQGHVTQVRLASISHRPSPQTRHQSRTPSRVSQVHVTDGRKQRDAGGHSFWTYVVRAQLDNGLVLLTERRYTDFVMLHEEISPCLALPPTFPVGDSATLLSALGAVSSKRTEKLQEYLAQVLARGGTPPPALLAFLRPPPFAAVASPAADCLEALPAAGTAQAVAILRGHAANERLQRAGCARLRELATASDAECVAISEAGGAERLCAALRRYNAFDDLAADACRVFAVLAAGAEQRHEQARNLLRRCGVLELLCDAMARHPQLAALQADCVLLAAALTAAQDAPLGLSSHFEVQMVGLACAAMAAHNTQQGVQMHGCAALHALARRSSLLAHEAVSKSGVQMVCKAMRTFRSNAARLQACGCAALAALVEAPGAREHLQRCGGGQLLAQTLCEHLSDADSDAAVHICGWRAMLALLAPPGGASGGGGSGGGGGGGGGGGADGEAQTGSGAGGGGGGGGGGGWGAGAEHSVEAPHELVSLLWHTMRLHARRGGVQAVCCEVLAVIIGEDARRAALHRADLQVLQGAAAAQAAMQQLCASLSMHWSNVAVAMPCLAAIEELVATVAHLAAEQPPRMLLAPADARVLQNLLHQLASSDPMAEGDELMRRRLGRIFHTMKASGLLEPPRKKR